MPPMRFCVGMLWISGALPWRAEAGETPDPYRVWLSEIMLQQTTVAAVRPYFEAFTARWPTVEALAAADEARSWPPGRGLAIMPGPATCSPAPAWSRPSIGGAFPTTRRRCASCPGIGAYTAAAIAAIAFGRRAVVVDANVERVVARLFAVDEPLPGGAAGESARWPTRSRPTQAPAISPRR